MKIKKGLWLILAITTVLLLAACKPKTVTIKFHTNGGTPLEEVSIRQKTTYEEPEIERTGYDFLGWYETANFTESSRFTFGGPINRNLVLYAKWQINSYQIAFFPDNGETIADMTVNFDANLTLPTPTKTGYQFSGWYIGSVTGQRFNATKMPAENLQLYAKWTIKSYDITFYVYDEVYITKTVDHGETLTDVPDVPAKVGKIRSWDRTDFTNITENIEVNLIEDDAFYTVTIKDDFGHVYETLTVKHGDPFVPAITPEKVGYDFVGYNPGLGTIITGDTEINVVYQQIFYRVIFRDHLSAPIVSVNVAHGNSATPPEFTPPEGYDFIGWSEDLTAITEDLVVDAVVSLKTYPFILHANDGQFANNSDTLSTTYAYQAVIGIPESPTRVGYQFGGWYLDDGTFNEVFAFSPSTTMPHESLELYAQWHLRNYNITYHNLEGTIQSNPATFNIETATITLTAPTNRTGYHFVGWFDALLGGNEITTIDKGTINNQTLYARWTPIEYTITYENLSGTTHTNPNAFTVETPTIHLLNPTAKEGYTFLGWFTALNGGSQVTKIDQGSTGNKTLYARFEANTYTITYDLAGGNGPVSLDVTYGEPFTLGVATKTGYSFMGWTYLGNPFISGVWTLTNHITLLATYTEDSYLITYENLNGTLANNPASYNIETPTIILADPSNRDGYDFVGWFTHNVGGTQVTQIEMGSMGHVTLYARWSPITYTITYKNIFALNANNPATYQITSATIHLANPENRIGFTFGGWFDALNGGNQVEKIENGSFGDISIYARWIPIDYSITYSNLNGTTTDNPVIYNIRTETFNLTDPTVRTGYNFIGWYTALSGGSKVTSVAQGTYGNKTFYARWEAVEYDLTYENLYGLNSNNPANYNIETATITLVSPANRIGYTFDGWFDALVGGNRVETIDLGSFGDMTLYARWSLINYSITYSNLNGTTTDNPTNYHIETATITLDDPTARIGYTFVGWFDALSGGNKVEEILIGSNGNKTLYARFEAKTYTITYDLDGGTGPVSLVVTYDENFTLGNASKTGYTFTGWTYLGNPFTSGKWEIDSDITIIAVYTPITYSITYNGLEDMAHANPASYDIETPTITLADPANRDGYDFVGWFTHAVGGSEVTTIDLGSTGNRTLYARWSLITYNITYGNLFGTEANNPGTYNIESATITLNDPANRVGYTFDGWFDALSGGDQIEEIENGSFGHVTVYARWSLISYSITYENLLGTTPNNPGTYTIETDTITLVDPSNRDGYNFVGWYTALSGGSKVTSINLGSNGNRTLYARWEAIDYDITYDNLYGLNSNNPETYQIISATITLVNPENRLGYTFVGWFDALVGGNQVEEIENGTFGDVTVYARWSPINYSITYENLNGTTPNNPASYDIETPTIILANPSNRMGYTFVGWFDALSGGSQIEEIEIGSTGNKTVYARFVAKTYTITYDLDGGMGPVSLAVTYDENFTLGNASKAGYNFTGWTYLGNPFTSGKWNLDTDITIIAVYTPVVYTITYNDLEGIAHANPLTYHIESATITLVDPENRDGYNFLGWFNVSNQEVEEIVTGSMGHLVLHATWETIDYTIHYENLFGLASNNPANYHIETATITLGNPANRVGYTFVGWFDALVGGNQVEEIENGSFGDLTVYARWSPINYTVTYSNLNGTTPNNPASYDIETPTIILADPSNRIGYDFVGWFDALVGGNQVEEIEEGSTGNKTIYARFEAKAYTITYDLDGGDGPASLNVTYDANFTLGVATKAGFTFKGWTYSGNPFVSGIWQIDDNITIIASWTEWPVISFNANGGTGTASISEEPGTAIAAPNSPTRVGYTFVHWFDADDSLAYVFTLMPAVDLTLNAKWAPVEYTISYENLNGTLTNNPGVYDIETATINLSDPTERTGYTFVGWYDEEVGGNQVEEIEIGSHGNLTLYARFEAKSYTITYNLSGGSGPASLSVTYDENFTLGVATKNGYTFNGWTYLGNPFVSGKWETDSDITIIATYTPVTYNITYHNLNGINHSNPLTYNIETATINLANPSARDGYDFVGWFTHDIGGAEVTAIVQGSTGNKVVYARWETVTYNITYENLFGLASNNPTTYDIETATIELVNPENRDGYTFVGWFDEEVGGNQVEEIEIGSFGDVTVYARWSPITYNITYDNLFGLASNNPATYNIETASIELVNPENRMGYNFVGWYDALSGGSQVEEIEIGSFGHMTLYARWSPVTYNITYENLFSLASNNPATYTIEAATINLANPEGRTGYTFVGWYDEEVDGNKVTQITIGSTENITLYARWSLITYNITYENLFDLDSNNPETYTIETATINLANPEDKTGYNFVGWYDEEVGGNQVTQVILGSHGNLTLYARFEAKSYTITYNLSGGSGPASLSVTYDENFTLGVATKNGYTFNGWTYLGNPFVSGKWSIDSDITIIATYTPVTYSITYNDLEGAGHTNPLSYNIETATITLTDPAVRTGYTFTGWFDGSNQEVEEIVLGSTGNLILYAKWSVVDYDIDYQNLNGTTTDNPETYNITTATITLDNPTARAGYDFVGWYDALVGGNQVTQIVLGSHGNLTLYARFEAKSYTITYDLDGGTGPASLNVTYDENFILGIASKDGYDFNGWTYLGNPFESGKWQIAANITIKAAYSAITYDITYENLFGLASNNPATYTIETATINLANPEGRTGYTFVGWYDEEVDGNKVTQIITGSTEDITLYARWSPITYNITYENLFDLDSNNPATYTIETATINLANPEDKTGYNFVGWYDEEVGGNQVTQVILGSHGNLTLYARFEAKSYTITYNLSGGSGPASLSVTYDENFTLDTPTKNGYTFNGWTYLGNPFVSGKWSIDSDITIIATYTPVTYSITYNDLFGTTQSNPATYNIETATIALTDPTARTGYIFDGWFDQQVNGNQVEEIVLGSTGHLILYARWSVVDYDIDYENLNGTTPNNPLTYNITTATITLDSPTLRTGYDFVGWYDALVGGNQVTQIVLGSHGNKTLYARWELTEFTITYNNLFDLDHNNPETYTFDTATITLINPDPRDHYTFDGWFDALEGGNQVTTIVKGSHGNKVLYAHWTPVQYSITYENLFDTVNSNTVSYNIEDSFQLTDPTIRTGYRFIGWFDDLDSGNRVLEFTLGTYGNKTLYARWEIAYYDISGTFVYTAYDISNDQTEIEETISTEGSQAFFIPQILHGTMISPVTEQEGYIFSKFEYLGNTYTDIEELITVVNDIVLEDLTVYYMRIILEVAFTQKNPDYNSLQDPPALEYMTEIRYVYYNSNLDQNNIPELHNEDLDITALWERSVFNNIKVTTDVSALYFSSASKTIRFKDGSSIIFIASLGEQNPAENFITTASLLWSLNRSGYKFLGWYYMDGGVETKLNIGNYNYNYFAGNQTEIYTKWELLPAYGQPQNIVVDVENDNIVITWELDLGSLAVPEFLFVIDKVVVNNYVTAVVRNGLEYTLTINSGSPDHPLFASLTEVGLHSVQIQALGDNQNSVNGIASEEYIYEELSIYETPPEAVNVYNYFIIEEYQESTRYIFYTNMTYQFSEGYIFEILTGSALVTAVDDHIIQMNNISGEFRFKLTKPDQSFVIYDALVIKDVKQFVFGSNYQTYLRETDSETSSYKLIDAPYYVGTGNDYYLDIRMTNTLGNRIPIDNVYLDYEVYLYSGGGYEVIQDISTHLTFKPNNRIEFKPAANGNTYKIVIKPKYQSTNMAVSPLTYEFTVNDGVNVFTHQELKQAFEDDEVQMINLHANIAPILSASQLNPDGSPINKKDLEGNVYNRKFNAQQQDNLVIQGNYMTINGSQLPYSNARSGSTIVGFAEAFEIINVQIAIFNYSVNDNENNWISNLTMNNLSIIGNTTVPSVNFGGTAEEILLQERLMSRNSGGYIGVMVSHGSSNFNNMQVKFSVIGFSNYAYGEDVEMALNHVIVDDSWANSVYMQGATETTLTNSYFGQSGGPAFHVSDSRQSAGINNPVFNIIDTEIENYISGEEAWFKAYGMSAVALQLKSAIETGIAPTGRSIIKLVTHPITGVQTEMINLILLTEPHSGAKEVDGEENVIGGSEVVINVEGTILARPYNYLLWPDPRINEGQLAFPVGLYSDLNDLDSLGTNIGTYAFTEYEKALSEGEIGQLVQLAAFYNFTHVQIVDAYKDAGYNMNNIANQISMKISLEGINPPQYFEVLSPLPVFPDGYAIVIIELQ